MNIKNEIRVLIVDDEPSIVLSLEFLMKKQGYQVYIARDGEEAMGMVKDCIPHIILLDIMMPKVNGYELCSHVKESDKYKNAVVIFLSAKNKADDIETGYEHGADLYIPKPFSTRELVKKVNQFAMGMLL